MVATLVVAALLQVAPATPMPCSEEMFEIASKRLEKLQERAEKGSPKRLWRELHALYQSYRACDDGPVAEAYAGVISVLLGRRWEQARDLQRIGRTDPQFARLVLDRFEMLSFETDLRAALFNAEHRCPPATGKLCLAIADASRRGLAGLEADRLRERSSKKDSK